MNLLELENRILQLRMDMNEFTRQTGALTSLEKLKIQAIEQDIRLLQSELNNLKNTAAQAAPHMQIPPQGAPHMQIPPQGAGYQRPPYANNVIFTRPQQQYQPKKTSDYEKFFGNSVMGIFAAVLIFISMILFGTLVIPRLSDVIKLAILYAVSIAASVAGLLLFKKNKFGATIAGCGLGAVYISLFLSDLYFHVFGNIALYIGLFFWAAFLCYLARTKSLLFQIIGQLGTLIAALYGIIYYVLHSDLTNLVFVLTFFITTETIYIAVFHSKRAKLDVIQAGISVFGLIYTLIHFLAALTNSPLYPSSGVILPSCILGGFLCLCILYMTFTMKKEDDSRIFRNLLMILDICLVYGLLARHSMVFAAVTLIIFLCYIGKTFRYELKFDIFLLFHAVIFLAAFQYVTVFGIHCLPVAAILLICSGFALRRLDLDIYGLLGFFIWLPQLPAVFPASEATEAGLALAIGCFLFLALSVTAFLFRKNAPSGFHIAVYCFQLILLSRIVLTAEGFVNLALTSGNFDLQSNAFLENHQLISNIKFLVSSMVVFLVNALCRQLLRSTAKKTGLALKHYLTAISIINIVFMLQAYHFVSIRNGSTAFHWTAALFLIITFLFNMKDAAKPQYGKLYIDIKLLVLMWILLDTFHVTNFIVSICCFAFACVSIFIGFKIQYKPIRLFGLVLSCIAAIKLVLLDILYLYTSDVLKAASFFICGIICLLIAFIYNVLDKKQQN